MPSIWSKITEYWQWFLWGKIPYNRLSCEKKKEARRDLYFRLFVIANAPVFVTFYCTHKLSVFPAMTLFDALLKVEPENEIWRKRIGRFCFGMYVVLHVITGISAYIYIVIPSYSFMFNCLCSLTNYYIV